MSNKTRTPSLGEVKEHLPRSNAYSSGNLGGRPALQAMSLRQKSRHPLRDLPAGKLYLSWVFLLLLFFEPVSTELLIDDPNEIMTTKPGNQKTEITTFSIPKGDSLEQG